MHLEKAAAIVRAVPRQLDSPLFLAGDIGNAAKPNYESFLGSAAENSKHVFLIAGNHEYRRAKSEIEFQEIESQITSLVKKIGNITFLNRKMVEYEGYVFAGATLWTHTHFSYSPRTDLENERHVLDLKFIESLSFCEKPVVMMTHHLPSYELISPYFAAHYRWGKMTFRWASHSDYLLAPPIKVWICGHSHVNMQKKINGVQILMAANASDPHTYSI